MRHPRNPCRASEEVGNEEQPLRARVVSAGAWDLDLVGNWAEFKEDDDKHYRLRPVPGQFWGHP